MKSIIPKSLLVAFVTVIAAIASRAEPEIKGSPAELAAYLSALPGTVQIVGEGEVKMVADRAIISLRIDTENKSLAEAIRLNHAIRTKLGDFLKEQGIGADRVQPAPFSSTQKQAVFSDKVKSHKVSTLIKVSTRNEAEFQAATRSLDQFSEVAYVSAEFDHSDKEALKSKASAKACEDAERQKRLYEEKLGVKLAPKSIQDQRQAPILAARRQAYESGDLKQSRSYTTSLPAAQSAQLSEVTAEESPFGELTYTARILVDYTVERK